MYILRRESDHGNLLPAAYNVIASIPKDLLLHTAHGTRHPASAYLTSLRLIAAQWNKFLDQCEKLQAEYLSENKTTNAAATTAEYAQLLHRLNEHLDACYAVLRAVCPTSRARPNHIYAVFLANASFPGWKKFREATRGYREEHVGFIVNQIGRAHV